MLPWPWADGEWDKLLALDVLEHLRLEVHEWLDECWRVLKPEGVLLLRLPAADNPVSWRDPQHRRVFTEESLDYFDPSKFLWQDYGRIYYPDGPWFEVLSVERTNPDPRYGIGDLGFVLRKREKP